MQQTTLTVPGMSCRSCVNKIEGNVSERNGVESVKVQLSDGKVAVTFNERTIDLAEIKQAIKETGYEVIDESVEEGGRGDSCCH